ncbi:MAG: YybH family protein [Steroidobacteraceae bacterium]
MVASLLCACSAAPHPRAAAPAHQSSAAPRAATPDQASAAGTAAVNQVIATEQAFAKTMANRDFKAFLTYLSPDAVFFSGKAVKHGPAEIAEQWQPFFDGPKAPFSWSPDHVEVLASGDLALSTGPVYESGKVVGRFNSIWRLEAGHSWHIVFDKGEAVCAKP